MAVGDPFDLVGGREIGVVLVHGFTGTPYELRYLADQLARDGFACHGPLLPGHGTSLDDLDHTTWRDWVAAVEAAVAHMRTRTPQVALVGCSLGGLLALHHAAVHDDVVAVASLAAPLWLGGLSGQIARWTAGGPLRRVRRLPKLGGSDVRDRAARAANPCYPAIPTRALGELLAFMPVVDAALPRVRRPLLVLHARQDHTAPVACAQRIADRARAERVRILPDSYHLIGIDVERDIVAAEVTTFLRRQPCAT